VKQAHVEVGGRRVRVLSGGSGPGLLMLHGFASGIDGWAPEGLRELSESRTLLALDLPGHGESERAAAVTLSSEAVVEMVAAVAVRVLGAEPVEWYGYSMGARIALSALRLGVPIRALSLESANPGIEDGSARSDRMAWDESWARRFEEGPLGEVFDAWLGQPIFATRRALPPTEAAHQRAVRHAADPESLAVWLREFGSGSMPPTWQALEDSAVPLRLLVGERDTRYLALARRILTLRPDAELTVVSGVGHAPHIEAPARWCRWLSGERPGP